ncbi:MAG: transposase, partial [Promethearchaeota archaeon]
ISNLGDVKVVFVKLEKGKNVSFFLVSNHLRLTGKEIVELYKLRWGIEIDYKFSKQEIGLSEWHLQKKQGILRYLTLCFITSAFLEYYRLMGCFGRHFGKDTLLNTKGKEVRAYRHLMFERFLIRVYEQCSRGRKIQDLLRQFREKNSRNHEVIQFTCQNTRLLLMSESA